MKVPNSLWIIKPGSLGDIVHTLPCAAAIRRSWPHTQITWIVDPRWAPLLEDHPAVHAKILFPRASFRGLGGIPRFLTWLTGLTRHPHPELCLDLQGLLRSALIARASRAPHILGLSDAREGSRFLHHQSVPTHNAIHAVDRYLRILAPLGIPLPDPPLFPLPTVLPPKNLPIDPPWIVLHPFARGASKSLSPECVLRFCESFTALPVILAGLGTFLPPLPPHCHNLLNCISLKEMLWLCRQARGVVSVDSGPAHIAAAVGTPLLAIHTWSDPRAVGPYSPNAWIWQGGQIRKQDLLTPPLPPRQPQPQDMEAIARWLKRFLKTL